MPSCFREETMKRLIRSMWKDDQGQDLAEYGILLVLISVAIVTAVVLFADEIVALFKRATDVMNSA
jgi:Flp pilus assembly pilin Flp